MSVDPDHVALRGGPLLIGHRGAAGLAPENTLPSFREAVERWGVDMIELDVRATSDGACVVIHDDTVDRTTDGTGPVASHTLAQLRDLDAGYRFRDEQDRHPFRGQGITVPTLDEVLETFPDTRFTFEIKIGTVQRAMSETIHRHDAVDRVVVAGMRYRDQALLLDYDGARSAPTREVKRFYAFHRLRLSRFVPISADVFQVPELHPHDGREEEGARRIVTPRFVRDAARRNIPVHVWTVNDPVAMRRLLDWGVDGLITDRPDIGAEVLADAAGRPPPPGRD